MQSKASKIQYLKRKVVAEYSGIPITSWMNTPMKNVDEYISNHDLFYNLYIEINKIYKDEYFIGISKFNKRYTRVILGHMEGLYTLKYKYKND